MESGTDATQDFTFYASTSGTLTSATDQVHTGSRSLKCSTGSPAVTAFAETASVLANAGRRISFWWQFDAAPSGAANFLNINSAGAAMMTIQLTTANKLQFASTGVGVPTVTGTTVLSTNTWYRICLSYFVTNSTTWTFKIYLNGALEITANTGTLTNATATVVRLTMASVAGASKNSWFSDIYVDDGASSSSQPDTGDIRVAAKRPFSNGTANQFNTQIGSGGSGYGTGHAPQVNEQPLSVTNGWSVVAVGVTTEEYNVEGAVVGDQGVVGTIVDLGGWLYAKAALAETGSMVLNGASSNISLTNANTLFRAYAGTTTYPAGTGTDIGIVTTALATTVSLYECGVLVAYTPASFRRLALLGVGN